MYSVDRTTKGANLFVGETIVSRIILINNMLSCIWNCILCWTFVKSYAVPVRVFYSPVHGCWMLDTNIFHSPHSYLFKECVMPNAVVTSENDPEVEMFYPQNRKKRWNKHLSQFSVRYNSKRFLGLLLLYFKVSLRDVYKHTDTWIFLESNNSESQFQPLDNDERRCVVGSGNESHIKNKYAKQRNVSFIKIT